MALADILKRVKNTFNTGVSNFRGNVAALSNPRTAAQWYVGATSPVLSPVNSRLNKIQDWQARNRTAYKAYDQGVRSGQIKLPKYQDLSLSFTQGIAEGAAGSPGIARKIGADYTPQSTSGEIARIAGSIPGYAIGVGRILGPLEKVVGSVAKIPQLAKSAPVASRVANAVLRKTVPAVVSESASSAVLAGIESGLTDRKFTDSFGENLTAGMIARGGFSLLKGAGKGIKRFVSPTVEKNVPKVARKLSTVLEQPRNALGQWAKQAQTKIKGLADLSPKLRKQVLEAEFMRTRQNPKWMKTPTGLKRVYGGQEAYGAMAGLEPEYDEEGKLTGVKFNPTKAAAGVAVMGGLKAIKNTNIPSVRTGNLADGLKSAVDQAPARKNQPSAQMLEEVLQPSAVRQAKSLLQTENTGRMGAPVEAQQLKQQEKKVNSLLTSVKDKANELYTRTIDRFNPISRLGKQAGKGQEIQDALTGYYGTNSTADYHIDYELSPILKEVDPSDLRQAAIAQRDIELAGRDIRGSKTQTDAQKILADLKNKLGDEKFLKLNESLEKLYAYQDKMVKLYLVDTGIMSKDAYQAMKATNQKYVPFKRVMDDVDAQLGFTPSKQAGSVSSQNVVKGIKGSDRDVVDPLQSVLENTYKLVSLGKRQAVARTIADLAQTLPEGVIRRVKGNVGSTPHISVFENGQKVDYEVPKEVADAAKGMTEDQMGTIVRLLSVPTQAFRATATGLNPEFMLPNVVRDLQSAFVNVGLNPLGFVQGLASMLKQDQTYQDFLRAGGRTSTLSLDNKGLQKRLSDITGEKGLTEVKQSKILNLLRRFGELTEQPTRIAAFKQTKDRLIKQGLSVQQAEAQAAYAAQEASVNFGRRGSETRTVNALYAFLNARVQGTDRLIRSIKNDPKGAGTRLAMITVAPALATYAWNRNFESYNDDRVVTQNDKENNFILMLSDTPIKELGGAQFIKIPKGDVGKFANPVEAFLSYIDGQGGDISGSLTQLLKSFSPIDNTGDFAPTAVRPIIEDRANKNFFTGYDIVPDYKSNLPAESQDTKYTAPLYRAIGDATNLSPARIENLSRGYLTGYARIAEMATQPLLPGYTSEENRRGATVNQTPVVRRFLGGEKKTEAESLEQSRNSMEYLQRERTMLRNKIRRGEIDETEGNKKLQQIESEFDKSRGKVKSFKDTSNKLVPQASANDDVMTTGNIRRLTKIDKSDIKDSLEYGDVVSESDLVSYYLGDISTGKSGYKNVLRQNELFKALDKVQDEELLSPEQKQVVTNAISKELNLESQDIEYYQVAKNSDEVKLSYLLEDLSIQNQEKGDFLKTIAELRKTVGNKQIATDKVIGELYELGYLTKDESKFLKSLKWDQNKKEIVLDRDYKDSAAKKSASESKKRAKAILDFNDATFKDLNSLFTSSSQQPKLRSNVSNLESILQTRSPSNDGLVRIQDLLNAESKRVRNLRA